MKDDKPLLIDVRIAKKRMNLTSMKLLGAIYVLFAQFHLMLKLSLRKRNAD